MRRRRSSFKRRSYSSRGRRAMRLRFARSRRSSIGRRF